MRSSTGLYEAIRDHAKKIARELDALTAQMASKQRKSPAEDKDRFAKSEQVLISLITDYRLELKAVENRTETEHEKILFDKRREMLDHLSDLLQGWSRSRPFASPSPGITPLNFLLFDIFCTMLVPGCTQKSLDRDLQRQGGADHDKPSFFKSTFPCFRFFPHRNHDSGHGVPGSAAPDQHRERFG
jgi:hypothetical protein